MNYTDDVNGSIIGSIEKVGNLFYGGRPQGQQVYGDVESITSVLKARMFRLIDELDGICYNTGEKWEVRVIN